MNLTVRATFSIIAVFNVMMLIAVGTAEYMLYQTEHEIIETEEARYESYLLADELRQDATDKTMLALTYASTGEERYKAHYQAIGDIFAGRQPRPQEYHRVYWDFYGASGQKPRPDGEAVPMMDMFKEIGYTDAELKLLDNYQRSIADLEAIERKAMQSRDGVSMLLSDDYRALKAKSLMPLDKFVHEVEVRTHAKAEVLDGKAKFYSLLGAMSLLALAAGLIGGGTIIGKRIVGPMVSMTRAMRRITDERKEDVTQIPCLDRRDEVGDLASALETVRLKTIEDRDRAAAQKIEAEKEKEAERIALRQERKEREREAAISEEIAKLIHASERGDFSQRIDLNGKDGLLGDICQGINNLNDVTERSLGEIKATIQNLSQGDLSRTVEGEYNGLFAEMQQAVNETIGQLQHITGEIRETAASVGDSANEIAAATTDLSNRTEAQASTLEETAASMEEITATVVQNTDNANDLRLFSDESKQVAATGGEVVKKVVESMGEISQSSAKIADIIGVIDEIAFQINLLALNAAVEAARAGDAGKGFAVVADEVRTLAGRSATASKEIQELIQSSVEQVKNGEALVGQAGESLDAIVESFNTLAVKVAGIAEASQEQAIGVREVNNAVTNMDQVTQQNAAMVEESTASAMSLSQMARGLNNLVAFFKTNSMGSRGKVVRHPSAAAG